MRDSTSIFTRNIKLYLEEAKPERERERERAHHKSVMKKMLKLSNGVSVQVILSLSLSAILLLMLCGGVRAWTGEIHGRVVCDVCGDSSIGPEDHALEGAEVAVLCITKSGEVLNYQAFTNSKGIYTVAETMPESDRWDACLARPISSFHEHCVHLGDGNSGVKFGYNHPSGYSHTVRPFVYQPADVPTYCL